MTKEFNLDLCLFLLEIIIPLNCLNCSTINYSFEESIRALHSIPIPSVKEEEKELMYAHFGDAARLYHSYHILFVLV